MWYLARGWMHIETGKCFVFDTALRVRTFYYHAMSEPYKEGKKKFVWKWGADKQFAVREAHFHLYNAEKKFSGMYFAEFSQGPVSNSRAAGLHRDLPGRRRVADGGAGQERRQPSPPAAARRRGGTRFAVVRPRTGGAERRGQPRIDGALFAGSGVKFAPRVVPALRLMRQFAPLRLPRPP